MVSPPNHHRINPSSHTTPDCPPTPLPRRPPPPPYACSPLPSPQWNPNPDHHVLAVGAGKSVVLIATGTGGPDASAITEALLLAASSGPKAKPAAPKGKEVVKQPEDSEQSDSEDEDDDEDREDMEGGGAGMGKKAPPVKWEALVPAAKGKGRRRSAATVDGSEGEVGPRVVLR